MASSSVRDIGIDVLVADYRGFLVFEVPRGVHEGLERDRDRECVPVRFRVDPSHDGLRGEHLAYSYRVDDGGREAAQRVVDLGDHAGGNLPGFALASDGVGAEGGINE